jgi:hypothetical protein
MIKLDPNTVLDEAGAVVAEAPEGYRYVSTNGDVAAEGKIFSCYYVHNVKDGVDLDSPEPGCIVGKILFRLGVPLDVMARTEVSSSGLLNALASEGVIEKPKPEVYMILAAMQRCQDLGTTWHTAYQVANATLQAFLNATHN